MCQAPHIGVVDQGVIEGLPAAEEPHEIGLGAEPCRPEDLSAVISLREKEEGECIDSCFTSPKEQEAASTLPCQPCEHAHASNCASESQKRSGCVSSRHFLCVSAASPLAAATQAHVPDATLMRWFIYH